MTCFSFGIKLLVALSIGLCFRSTLSLEDGCAFRGKCGTFNGIVGQLPIPCVYDDLPVKMDNQTLVQQLSAYCPDLALNEDPTVCCDDTQARNFITQMSLPKGFLGRCPSCFANFARVFCHMTCSRHQATFVEVTYSEPSTIITSKSMVANLTYNMKSNYAIGLFDSCKYVLIFDSGIRALDMMCPIDDCCPYSWLKYMGTKGVSPIQIDFNFHQSSDAKAMNADIFAPGIGEVCGSS